MTRARAAVRSSARVCGPGISPTTRSRSSFTRSSVIQVTKSAMRARPPWLPPSGGRCRSPKRAMRCARTFQIREASADRSRLPAIANRFDRNVVPREIRNGFTRSVHGMHREGAGKKCRRLADRRIEHGEIRATRIRKDASAAGGRAKGSQVTRARNAARSRARRAHPAETRPTRVSTSCATILVNCAGSIAPPRSTKSACNDRQPSVSYSTKSRAAPAAIEVAEPTSRSSSRAT